MARARVLVVDDSSFARAVINDSLTSHGMQVVGQAADGIQALDLYRRLRPDVVTLDLSMPGLDGLSTLGSIVELDPRARVVVVSVSGQEDVVVRALQLGAIGFLLKPFEPQQLVDLLARTGVASPAPHPEAERRRRYVVEAERRLEALAEDVRDLAVTPEDAAILGSLQRHARALGAMSARIGDGPTRGVAEAIDRAVGVARGGRPAVLAELCALLRDTTVALHRLLVAAARGDDDRIYGEAFRDRLDNWILAVRARGLVETEPGSVLVVDLDGGARRILEGFLGREGIPVDVADGFAAGVEAAQARPPTLVILDVDGLRLDGPALIRRLRADPATAATPTILLTPRTELSHKLAAFAAGADDVIVKPYEPEEVVARVQALLSRSRRAAASQANGAVD